MKVRCIKSDSWVTADREYVVLGVYGRGASFKYRLIGDDKRTPALHDSGAFELSFPQIPADWIFKVYAGVEWEMTPAAWATAGFWEAYFDGQVEAKSVFAQVISILNGTESPTKSD